MRTRTTIAIDNDVMSAARAISAQRRRSLGAVLSDLARKGLERDEQPLTMRNGIPMLPSRGVVVTLDIVNALRDDEG